MEDGLGDAESEIPELDESEELLPDEPAQDMDQEEVTVQEQSYISDPVKQVMSPRAQGEQMYFSPTLGAQRSAAPALSEDDERQSEMSTSQLAKRCWQCKAKATGKFCSDCGANQAEKECGTCGAKCSPNSKFCSNCGEGLGMASPKKERVPQETPQRRPSPPRLSKPEKNPRRIAREREREDS